MMAGKRPIEPLAAGQSGDDEVDAFLQSVEQGWILNPALVGLYARVPEGLKGWRRMVEGLVETLGPVTWEVVAHRTAAVTGVQYETTHSDKAVREEVAKLVPALQEDEVDASRLSTRHCLAAALAQGVAHHEVTPELFHEVKTAFTTPELVALCMSSSLTHVAQLVANTLGVSPDAKQPVH